MRRLMTLFTALLFALTMLAGTAVAMQPPGGETAQDLFGCVDGSPVPGHPGAAGLTDAAPRVHELTGDPTPTAWNAVEHADPVTSSCAD